MSKIIYLRGEILFKDSGRKTEYWISKELVEELYKEIRKDTGYFCLWGK